MPSRLKSLELQGYKTFANRTRFEFGPRITAIVGPNGSGKSNIADALRWVLGEQSYAALRAHKTEDMIFAGSAQRPRAGMATATIVFDNSERWLPIDYTEVALARKATRDGQNEYRLNGQRVRLRDIRELLGHAGLTENSYTFIGQGLVDAALALRPDERRQMLESAAGIGVYRQRREETLRRLETTRRNLERVQDILAELEPRLRRLERQARRSREAAQLQADLELMLREWYAYRWHESQRRLTAARQTAQRQSQQRERVLAQQRGLATQLAALRREIAERREQLSAWHRDLAAIHRQIERIGRERAILDERQRALETRRQDWLYESARLQARQQDLQARLAEVEEDIRQRREAHAQALQRREAARLALEDILTRRREARKALEQAQRRLEQLTRRQAALEARLADAERRRGQAQRALAGVKEALPPLETEAARAQQALAKASEAHRAAEAARQKAQAAVQQAQAALRQAEQEAVAARRAAEEIQAELAAAQAEYRVLEEAERNLTGYAEGTRWLLRRAKRQGVKLDETFARHLHFPAELETALAAALAHFTEAVLVPGTWEDAPLDLGKDAPARTALIPTQTERALPPPLTPPEDAEVVGVAAALVTAPPELQPAVEALLGQVLIVRSRAAALRALPHLPPHAWVVTLEGEAFSPRGLATVGKPSGGGTLRRQRERRTLQARIEALKETLRARQAAVQQAETAVASASEALRQAEAALQARRSAEQEASQAERRAAVEADRAQSALAARQVEVERWKGELAALEKSQDDLRAQQVELEEALRAAREAVEAQRRALRALDASEAHAQEAHWSTEAALAAQALEAAQRRLRETRDTLAEVQQRWQTLQTHLAEAEAQMEEFARQRETLQVRHREHTAQAEQLQRRISPAQEALEQAQSRLETLEAEAEEVSQAVQIAERHHAQAQLALSRAQEALETLRRRMEDDLGPVAVEYAPQVSGPQPLPLEGMVSHLPRVDAPPEDLETRIKQQRAKLRRLGPVNPEAEQEYQEAHERYTFLTTQMEDLQAAEANIRQAIAELEDLMQTAFQKTFAVVNREFSAIFTRLFGGGKARLVLTHPDDVTQTGVEIEARLPGKRAQRLAMLSGGERSLTAVALIFALLKASPTPFCVLDEVDAMLDEANVGRFRELLVELSEHTQFVVITHNRNTVQAAEVIYGVTLAPDATSQVMSLKLEEVLANRETLLREG